MNFHQAIANQRAKNAEAKKAEIEKARVENVNSLDIPKEPKKVKNKNRGIYVWTNQANCEEYGWQYAGQSKNRLRSRCFYHTKERSIGLLADAIRKFGIENFSLQLIPCENVSDKELTRIERDKILELGSLKPHGYNDRLPDPESKDIQVSPTYFRKSRNIVTCDYCDRFSFHIDQAFMRNFKFYCDEECYKKHCKETGTLDSSSY